MNEASRRRLLAALGASSPAAQWTPLKGGLSAAVWRVDLAAATGHGPRCVVVRQPAADNPISPADEFALLERLHARGVPVPEPILLHREGGETDALVMAHVENEGLPRMDPEQLDDAIDGLLSLHALEPTTRDLEVLPRMPPAFPESSIPGIEDDRAQRLLDAARAFELPGSRCAIVHGDYWPGNLLYRGNRLHAIIDWEDAVLAPPLADLAVMRIELAWEAGFEAMAYATNRYLARADAGAREELAEWDLVLGVRRLIDLNPWNPDAETRARLRRITLEIVETAAKTLN